MFAGQHNNLTELNFKSNAIKSNVMYERVQRPPALLSADS